MPLKFFKTDSIQVILVYVQYLGLEPLVIERPLTKCGILVCRIISKHTAIKRSLFNSESTLRVSPALEYVTGVD